MRQDWKAGAEVRMGCDHDQRRLDVALPDEVRATLGKDFD